MTKEDFLNASIEQISQVYNGMRNCCRCGCKGDYIRTSFMINPRGEINDKLVQKRLKRAKKLVMNGADCDFGENYIDVECGNNRTLTFYFDEV